MSLPIYIDIEVLPTFPARIVGAGGFGVDNENGVVTVHPAYDTLTLSTDTDPDNLESLVLDISDGLYKRVRQGDVNVVKGENVGLGLGEIYAGVDGNTLQFKTLVSDGPGTITQTATEVTIHFPEASVPEGSITNSLLADMPANSLKGNNTGAATVPLDLAPQQIVAMLPLANATDKGLLPQLSADATDVLRGDGSWGDAPIGPGSITDTELANDSVTAPKLAAEVAVRLIEFDVRDPQFAGGAKWNDIDDDTPAVAAAIAYFQTLGGLNQYEGKNAATLRFPRGIGRISNLDVTAASNVHFIGEGDGVTTLRNTGNNPCIKSTNVAGTNDAFRVRFEDFCIYGPGRANVNAHGFDLGALNNGAIKDVRFYACRDAIRTRNSWQTDITRPKIDGGPTVSELSCYRGLCLLDGPGSVLENAVKVYGGIISACELYGVRGESITGSAFFGLEVLACDGVGVYFGDSPSGKDLKWFTWSGGIIDTCGDLLRINRGGASYGGQLHFSGMWLGYADQGGGQGVGIELNNIVDSTFRPDVIFNIDVALVARGCSNVTFDAGVIQGYDRSLTGSVPIQLENSSGNNIRVGAMKKATGSPSTSILAEIGTSNQNIINDIRGDGGMTIIGPATIVKGCYPYLTHNSGSAAIAAGTSSVVVSHGLGRPPSNGDIMVVPQHILSDAGLASFAVDTLTATTFTIRANTNATGGIGFSWQGDVSRG